MMELLCNEIGLFILESKNPFLMALIFIYSAKLHCMYAIFLRRLFLFKFCSFCLEAKEPKVQDLETTAKNNLPL
ncbi:hypothetical protein C1634_015645 [Chryseobacterium viscerum]|uniref:Uncharacterized protein n=1 Tax=Chryseobacterium viscerum TaxID=1037377 RepID=A0A316WG20_9FLAO|nr:hypothetical protein C1634_015645 [Chryseobacterium viscerum]